MRKSTWKVMYCGQHLPQVFSIRTPIRALLSLPIFLLQ